MAGHLSDRRLLIEGSDKGIPKEVDKRRAHI
jgi:hypothetical protein